MRKQIEVNYKIFEEVFVGQDLCRGTRIKRFVEELHQLMLILF